MTNHLSFLITKINSLLKDSFQENVNLFGIVKDINYENNLFYLHSIDNKKSIQCQSVYIDKYNNGDKVNVRGYIQFNQRSGKIYILVEDIYLENIEDKHKEAIKNYNKLERLLDTPKYTKKINTIKNKKIPDRIINIGIIVPPNNDDNLQNFKAVFQEKCVGNLYVFKITDYLICNFASTALQYFKKYHDIDLICILSNNLTFHQVLQMSSTENISYMIDTTNSVYIASIIPIEFNSVTDSLTSKVSNISIDGIFNCVEWIHSIQTNYKNKIENTLKIGLTRLNTIVNLNRQKLYNHKLIVAETIYLKSELIQKLKNLIIYHLNRIRSHLQNKKIYIMQNIINDDRLISLIGIIKNYSEKKIENKLLNNITNNNTINTIQSDGNRQ